MKEVEREIILGLYKKEGIKMNKLFFLLELSYKGLLKNKKINMIVILSLSLGMLMPIILLANLNVFWINVKNLYPEISENTFWGSVKSQHITMQEYEEIQSRLEAVCMGGIEWYPASIQVENSVVEREVGAVSVDYLDFIRYDILSGRSITKEEIQSAAKVCMLEENFLENNILTIAVGDKVSMEGESFEVVGIYRSMDLINTVLIPASVFDTINTSARNMINVFIQFKTSVDEATALIGMEEVFDSVWEIKPIEEYFAQIRSYCFEVSFVLVAVTIPLTVFSVINCILVIFGKIAQMRHVIGIKMALGAGRSTIFWTGFLENSILSVIAFGVDLVVLPFLIKTVPEGFLLQFDWKVFVLSFGLLILLCFLLSLSTTRRMMKIDIASVLKGA